MRTPHSALGGNPLLPAPMFKRKPICGGWTWERLDALTCAFIAKISTCFPGPVRNKKCVGPCQLKDKSKQRKSSALSGHAFAASSQEGPHEAAGSLLVPRGLREAAPGRDSARPPLRTLSHLWETLVMRRAAPPHKRRRRSTTVFRAGPPQLRKVRDKRSTDGPGPVVGSCRKGPNHVIDENGRSLFSARPPWSDTCPKHGLRSVRVRMMDLQAEER